MKILTGPELKAYLDATCVYDGRGKIKPFEQRHGLLALNVYSDAWLIAGMAISAKLKTPIILESSPRVFGDWGSGKPIAGVYDAHAYLENAQRFGGRLVRRDMEGREIETLPFDDAVVAMEADHVTAPKPGAPDYDKKRREFMEYAEASIASGKICYFMCDAGELEHEENVRLTRQIADLAHAHNCLCEGEYTAIGGVEDGKTIHAGEALGVEEHAQAILDFVKQTGVDVIAYDFGTLHGAKSDQKRALNTPLLERVNELLHREGVWRPTTGHGGTSVSDEDARGHRGYISKLNKATIGKVVATKFMRDYFARYAEGVDAEDKSVCDPGKLIYGVAGPLAAMLENFVHMIGAEGAA
jgi:fructose/tagatose bisphosphate aldolase